MDPRDALDVARDKGLDLVEVAPDARPPVCKIMDYGKLRYDQTKKKSKPKKQMELKTITLRPKTGEHDLQTKLKHARKFLHRGDNVRFPWAVTGRALRVSLPRPRPAVAGALACEHPHGA